MSETNEALQLVADQLEEEGRSEAAGVVRAAMRKTIDTGLGTKAGGLSGTVPDGTRDAFHVGAIRVWSHATLNPGERVQIRSIGNEVTRPRGVWFNGIVDPFLAGKVEPYERFWVLVTPGSITSKMRHVFDVADVADAPLERAEDELDIYGDDCDWESC
jgi:hypothetical protein